MSHELDHELLAEGMRQLVERFDGRRALRSLEALVSLWAHFRAPCHFALLLAPARLEEFVRNLDSRGKFDRVEPLVGIGHCFGENHRIAEIQVAFHRAVEGILRLLEGLLLRVAERVHVGQVRERNHETHVLVFLNFRCVIHGFGAQPLFFA